VSKLEENRAELEKVREEMRKLNRNNKDEAEAFAELKELEDALIDEIQRLQAEETVEEKKEQISEEVSEKVLRRNYNALFEDPEANKLIHGDMMEQALGYEKTIAAKDDKIQTLTKQGMETENQLAELRDQFAKLQTEADQLRADNTQLNEHIGTLNAAIMNKDAQVQQLQERLDDEIKESRFYRNESARLTLQNQQQQSELDALRSQKKEFTRNESLDDLAARIAERSAHKKKQLANVRTNTDGSITGINAEGSEETVPWYAVKSVEAVESFPEPPEIIIEEVEESSVDPVAEETFHQEEAETIGHTERAVEEENGRDPQPNVGTVATQTWEQWMNTSVLKLAEEIGVEIGEPPTQTSFASAKTDKLFELKAS